MPMHDWTRVDAGLYHAFHHRWIDSISDALNGGSLPAEYFALPEQRIGGPIPDVLTLQKAGEGEPELSGGGAVALAPPRAKHVRQREGEIYASRANRVAVRHRHGDVVAVIELVSPGNKAAKAEFRAFVQKSAELLRAGIHLLVVDPFPPGPRDPNGIHPAIWNEFDDDPFTPPPEQPLTAAAYDAGHWTAYVEPFAVGEPVPDLPLFLRPGRHVVCPLEATYLEAWRHFPAALKGLLG